MKVLLVSPMVKDVVQMNQTNVQLPVKTKAVVPPRRNLLLLYPISTHRVERHGMELWQLLKLTGIQETR